MGKDKGFVRKQYFIDRNIQGKYMISFLIPMLIMLVFMLVILYFAAQNIVSTTSDIIRKDFNDITAEQFMDKQDPEVSDYRAVLDEMKDYLRSYAEEQDYRRAVLTVIMIVLGIGTMLVVIQITLLTIFFSHKIAGPVYRFKKACDDIVNGDYSRRIKLRKGDQMQDLAEKMNESLDATKERFETLKNCRNEEEKDIFFKNLKF